MKPLAFASLAAAAAFALAPPLHAQAPARVRGAIVDVTPSAMTVRTREGRDVVVKLADDLAVSVVKAARFDEIKEGDVVGTTTRRSPDGEEVALEVHFLPPTARLGQSAWDLEPKSTMINAPVRSKVVGTGDRQLLLRVGDGEQKVVVPPSTPIVRSVPGTRADLAPGEAVFLSAQVAADGALTAQRVQVGKDGVKPPQ